MNLKIEDNFLKLKTSLFLVPILLLFGVVVFLISQNSLSTTGYVEVQKDVFLRLNKCLSQFRVLELNLTQLGDALLVFSILSIVFVKASKMWSALLASSLISLLVSSVVKNLFKIPRPAAIYDQQSFTIIGKTLTGHNSMPSGHSITIFTTLTVLLFAFMPKKPIYKCLYIVAYLILGYFLAFSRVGVGAHYPLDVIVGSALGFFNALLGVFICRKYKILDWIGNRKFYPIFVLAFLVCGIILISKITKESLFIYYLALICLVYSLYNLVYVYLKKQN